VKDGRGKFTTEVDHVEINPKLSGNISGPLFLSGLHGKIGRSQAHEKSLDFIILPQEQATRSGVHPATQSNANLLFLHRTPCIPALCTVFKKMRALLSRSTPEI
jgi:hypothetical protein